MTNTKKCLNGEYKKLITLKHEQEETKNTLKELCRNNAEYFSKDSSENGQRLYISFLAIVDAVDSIWPKKIKIEQRVAEYDFDEQTPGNGYRSYLHVVDLAIQLAMDLNQKVLSKRGSVLFRKSVMTKDVESCSHLVTSLDGCLKYLEMLLVWSNEENLFVRDDHTPEELLTTCGEIDQHCFYGRNLGFQFCDSIKNVLQFIALSMTLFSEVYYSQGSIITKATNSVMSTTKYITDPEQRARRIVNISQNAEVDFCKAFWFLSETDLMNHLPSIVSPSVAVSKVIQLPPEPLSITIDGKEIDIPVPSSYIGRKNIQVRLISYKVREGMLGTKSNSQVEPPSRGLLFHCHGGGFVAQSSKSHETYLRDWAKHLDVPILCVDYSLAPEAPYPRALEEVTYAYCWALKNYNILGSTGERIIGVGDSAGANLLLCKTLKCIHMGVPTLSGLFLAYVPTGVHFTPSPARMLCMMDPLLPFGFLMRCLKAYAVPDPKLVQKQQSACNSDTESFEEITESDLLELQAHKSPISDTSDTLTYGSLTDDATGKPIDLNASDIDSSQNYVSDFLEKYVLESDTDTDGTKTYILKQESSSTSSTALDNSLQNRVTSIVTNLRGQFTKFLGDRGPSGAERYLDLNIDIHHAMVEKFSFTVPKDPYLSPIYACDEDLKKFPPTSILSVHLDPCLDDCVMFAKKLKRLGNNVKLDILDGLPHGFLNFSLFSKEAYEASLFCIERVNSLLNLDGLPPRE